MSRTRFKISYDGQSMRTGIMDVRDLAPSLLAVGDLLQEINRTVNGPESEVKLFVRADIRHGSFTVDLVAVQSFLEKAKTILSLAGDGAKNATELAKLGGLVGSTGKQSFLGLLSLKKWLAGRQPEQQVPQKGGRVKLSIGVETEFTREDVLALLDNKTVMRAVDRITAPLDQQGIDVFKVLDPKTDKVVEELGKEDRPNLRSAPVADMSESNADRDDAMVSHRTTILRIIKPSFRRGNKYQVAEGDVEFAVDIEDDDFLARVENDEIRFCAHGRLRVLLRQEIISGEDKDRVAHSVEKVLDYIEPASKPTQPSLLDHPSSSRTDHT